LARTEEVQFLKIGYKLDKEDMVFNADETGLNWKLLQSSTLASGAEQTARNFKVVKDSVTVLVCANATGKCDFYTQICQAKMSNYEYTTTCNRIRGWNVEFSRNVLL